jgi:hypothetical protein
VTASSVNNGLSAEQVKPEKKSGSQKKSGSLMAWLLELCLPGRRAKQEGSAKAKVRLKKKKQLARDDDSPPEDPTDPPPPPPPP